MDELLKKIIEKKTKLDSFRPLPPELVKNLDEWFKIELTYTSNAIEGNTLTRQETALVVEKGITVAGKSLTEHLEATNHAQALDFIKSVVGRKNNNISEKELLEIHRIILSKIDDNNAGRYRNVPVRIAGSTVIMPNPLKVPDLMVTYFSWLNGSHSEHNVQVAVDAHFKLVSIHPFVDGNGRTARLLMNLILLQGGYPPALIKKENRLAYINAIEKGQLTGEMNDYSKIMYESIDSTLDIYINALEQKDEGVKNVTTKLLKIGELAKRAHESVVTIRFWTQKGLLRVEEFSESGYQLFSEDMIEVAEKIRELQKEKRLSIDEIKNELYKK